MSRLGTYQRITKHNGFLTSPVPSFALSCLGLSICLFHALGIAESGHRSPVLTCRTLLATAIRSTSKVLRSSISICPYIASFINHPKFTQTLYVQHIDGHVIWFRITPSFALASGTPVCLQASVVRGIHNNKPRPPLPPRLGYHNT